MAVEFLLLNGAKINTQDADGKTPLHLATELGNNFYYFEVGIFFVLYRLMMDVVVIFIA